MSLLQQIRDDQMDARKNGAKLSISLLTTLLSEAAMVGFNDGKRESTDEEVIATIKKFLKGIDETLAARPKDALAHAEQLILGRYLPQQMTEDEIRGAVWAITQELDKPAMKMMGAVMKTLKEMHGGQYDGKLASQVVKKVLSGK